MSTEHPGPRQMEDELPTGRLLGVAAIALLVGLVGVLATWSEWRFVERQSWPQGPPPLPQALGAPEQGLVFQRPFDELRTAAEIDRLARERLATYGWVDRPSGVAHVPIDVAADEVVRRSGR